MKLCTVSFVPAMLVPKLVPQYSLLMPGLRYEKASFRIIFFLYTKLRTGVSHLLEIFGKFCTEEEKKRISSLESHKLSCTIHYFL
jgi:hypothetical protein